MRTSPGRASSTARMSVARPTALLLAFLVLAACAGQESDEAARDDGARDEAAGDEEGDDDLAADDEVADDVEAAPEAESGGLVMTGYYEDSQIGPFLEAWAEHRPDIPLTYEGVPFNDLTTVLQARLGAGDATPDVYTADQPRIPNEVDRGFLDPITDDFPDAEETWLPATVEASSVDGELYAVPINSSTQFMYINVDLFEGTDVELPSADPEDRWTWEETVEAARAAQEAGADWGLQFGQVGRIYQMQALPESLGGGSGLVAPEYTEPDLTNDGWVEAMEWFQMIHEEGIAPRGVTPEETPELFNAGQLALFVSGPWHLGSLEEVDFEYAVTAHPYFADGVPVTATGSWSWGINPNTENREAAVELLRFASEDPVGVAAMLEGNPNIPASLDALEDYVQTEEFTTDYGGWTVGELMQYEVAETAVIRAPTPQFVVYETIMGDVLEDIRNGEPVEQTLENGEGELQGAMGRRG